MSAIQKTVTIDQHLLNRIEEKQKQMDKQTGLNPSLNAVIVALIKAGLEK